VGFFQGTRLQNWKEILINGLSIYADDIGPITVSWPIVRFDLMIKSATETGGACLSCRRAGSSHESVPRIGAGWTWI
jgi:hypothetical protein